MADGNFTHKQLTEMLHYDPETGAFTRKVSTAFHNRPGDRADTLVNTGKRAGYRRVCLLGDRVHAHRLAWFYVYGTGPTGFIDHANGERGDNRISNLRDVTQEVNTANRVRPNKNKKDTKFLGAFKAGRKWCSRIHIGGKKHWLGMFDTAEEAHKAYCQARDGFLSEKLAC